MGSHQNITHDKFPKQGDWPKVGSRVTVCYHFDASKSHHGTCVRNDEEEPGELIFALDNGRYVRAGECMWQPFKGS